MKFAWRGEIERAADPVALQPALLDQPAGAGPLVRILEDAPERALVRRLRRLALREQLGGTSAFTSSGELGSSRKRTPATTSPGASSEWR